MDRELLAALNNLSESLGAISEALAKGQESKSATSTALSSGDIGKQILQISKDLEEIKDDNKKILKNTETILQISKEKSNSGIFGFVDSKNKDTLKQGVGVILLLAGGILALGLAFKVIGSVDFASVIALSISLPLVAMAFEKIALMKDLTPSNILNIMLVTTGISLAILAASYILSAVKPIGLMQGITAIMIAGTFAVIAPNIVELITAFKGVSLGTALKSIVGLPLVLLAISTAIYLSSHVLSRVEPIGLFQAITGILIAGMFGVISLGIGKLIQGFKGMKASELALIKTDLPWLLVGIATAITASSFILGLIRPIGFSQFLTALGIAIVFVPIGYAIAPVVKSLKDLDYGDILKLPFMLVTIAGAITLSSYIFARIKTIPFLTLFNMVLQSIAVSVASLALGFTFGVLNKIGIENIAKGAIAFIAIAGAMALSSIIISKGNYGVYPGIDWVIGTGFSILAFGLISTVFGLVINSGIGAEALIVGGVAIVGISGIIVASAAILSEGNYSSYPPFDWIKGVGLSITAFGVAAVAIGALVATGVGAIALGLGVAAILTLSGSIVGTDLILNSGSYKKYPSILWISGVEKSLTQFGKLVMSLSLYLPFIKLGTMSLKLLATSIVSVDKILSTGKYKIFPPLTWATGISKAMVSFTTTLKSINLSGFALNIVGKLMGTGPVDIAKQIVEVDNILRAGDYKIFPSSDWSMGVVDSLLKFSSIVTLSGVAINGIADLLGNGPVGIAQKIVEVDKIFSGGQYNIYPGSDWTSGVVKSISKFLEITSISGLNNIGSILGNGPIDISRQIVEVDRILRSGEYRIYPSYEWSLGAAKSLSGFIGVVDIKGPFGTGPVDMANQIVEVDKALAKGTFKSVLPGEWVNEIQKLGMLAGVLKSLTGGGDINITSIENNLNTLARSYDKIGVSVDNLNKAISKLDTDKLMALKGFTSNVVLMSLMDPGQFEKMMDALDRKASKFVNVMDVVGGDAKSGRSVGAAVTVGNKQTAKPEVNPMSQKMDVIIKQLADIQSVVGSSGSLKDYLEGLHQSPKIGQSHYAPN